MGLYAQTHAQATEWQQHGMQYGPDSYPFGSICKAIAQTQPKLNLKQFLSMLLVGHGHQLHLTHSEVHNLMQHSHSHVMAVAVYTAGSHIRMALSLCRKLDMAKQPATVHAVTTQGSTESTLAAWVNNSSTALSAVHTHRLK
jgi:hypothetical protein